jgi:hypothetical protein
MLVFSWAGKIPTCQMPRDQGLKVSNIQFRVKPGSAPGQIMNRATMINSENPITDIKTAADVGFLCEASSTYPTYNNDDVILGASGGMIA